MSPSPRSGFKEAPCYTVSRTGGFLLRSRLGWISKRLDHGVEGLGLGIGLKTVHIPYVGLQRVTVQKERTLDRVFLRRKLERLR